MRQKEILKTNSHYLSKRRGFSGLRQVAKKKKKPKKETPKTAEETIEEDKAYTTTELEQDF